MQRHAGDGAAVAVPLYRPSLVDTRAAAVFMQRPPAWLAEAAECGRVLWVFDLAKPGSRRTELRFWLRELEALDGRGELPHGAAEWAAGEVVGASASPWLYVSTLCARWQVGRRSVHDWAQTGQLAMHLEKHRARVNRASTVEFLPRRWLGAAGGAW